LEQVSKYLYNSYNFIIVPLLIILSFLYLIIKSIYSHSPLLLSISIFFIILGSVISYLNFANGLIILLFLTVTINSIPFIIIKAHVIEAFYPISLFLFLGFIIGSYYKNPPDNLLAQDNSGLLKNNKELKILWLSVILFTGAITISLLFTILNNINFYPFKITEWHIYNINVLSDYSITAIVKSIYMYLNYVSKFILLILLIKNIKIINRLFLLKLFYSLFIANIIIFILSLYQIYIDNGLGNLPHWETSNRINSTMTDPNSFGFFLVLNTCIFFAYLFYLENKQKILCLLIIFISILQLMFTGSRTGLLGLAIFILIILIYLIIFNLTNGIKKRDKKSILRSTYILLMLVLIIILPVIFFTNIERFTNMPPLLERIKSNIQIIGTEDFLTKLLSYRNIIWPQAINVVKDYPFTGVGIGTFPLELSNYYKLFNVDGKVIDYVLNSSLQILSENGILTFIFFASFYITILSITFKNYKAIKIVKNKLFLIPLILAIIISILMSNTIPGTNFFEIQIFHSFILCLIFSLSIKFKENEVQKNNKND